ncbi:uncharacterized protein FOMMEDRAFT_157433 [Fomitiporia mediterranea MF3/22]|uniref:uncharacterized protein n=1 Tax=Fomitiporia mediterranea (strain MF3/22) TaxID=694068 RepID=UPI0004408932|nr:uncharacterized protein FOMMEDRAFT_157433 [Fomitiporia mediterranea MF3/22]EJD02220.1 hypothetical protein FOMMEDRAFT_157433 [Fomitiporia mediterranea MF3/22]
MLAQSPPQSAFVQDSSLGKRFKLGMDMSPSKFVTHAARPLLNDFQSLDTQNFRGQVQQSGSMLPTSYSDPRLLLQPSALFGFSGTSMGVQNLFPSASTPSIPSLVSTSAISSHTLPHPLSVDTGLSDITITTKDTLSSGYSSPASGSRPQTASDSRRTNGIIGGSPRSTPVDTSVFCRTSDQVARQRTAQACEKCRDRKTKCSGTRPTCKRCADRGLKCVWAPDTRLKGPSNKPNQTKLESGDNTGGPLPALPVPLSEPSSCEQSPQFRADDTVQSAPATQTTFQSTSLPEKLFALGEQKQYNSGGGPRLFRTTGAVRGMNAHHVMGEPIKPISTDDDCWFSIGNAAYEPPSMDRDQTINPFNRRNSVSVGHLALARNSHGEPKPLPHARSLESFETFNLNNASPALYYTGQFSHAPSSPSSADFESSVPSSATSDSHPSIMLPAVAKPQADEHLLAQSLPSFDTSAQLNEEMMNMLSSPIISDGYLHNDGLDFLDGFSSLTYSINDSTGTIVNQTTPLAQPNPEAAQNTNELFSQFFNADAFNEMQS